MSNKVQHPSNRPERSTFGERLQFARWWQAGTVIDENDTRFGAALGVTKTTISGWKARNEPLRESVCQAIADRTGVDSVWLELGERGASPAPLEFARWLAAHRRGRAASAADAADVRSKLSGKKERELDEVLHELPEPSVAAKRKGQTKKPGDKKKKDDRSA